MDNNAVGSFASGLANGLGLGMKYGNTQGGQKEPSQAQQDQQQAPAPQNLSAPAAQLSQQPTGSMGLPTSYTGYAPQQSQQPVQQPPQAPAASSTQGNGPWSFISSLFSGAGNNG